jgi:hypothetical protein
MEEAEYLDRCELLMEQHRETIVQAARQAVLNGYARDQFVIVCVNGDDPDSADLVRHLREDHGYDVHRGPGIMTAVIGAFDVEDAVDSFQTALPVIAEILSVPRSDGSVRIVVIDSDYAGVFFERLEKHEVN